MDEEHHMRKRQMESQLVLPVSSSPLCLTLSPLLDAIVANLAINVANFFAVFIAFWAVDKAGRRLLFLVSGGTLPVIYYLASSTSVRHKWENDDEPIYLLGKLNQFKNVE